MKDRTISAVKGLAIIGVVFHHVTNRRVEPLTRDLMLDIVFVFNWCVLAFICVSGYLQAMSDAKRHRSLPEFIRNRFSRLIVPFLLLALVYSCLWQIILAFHIRNIGVRVPPTFIGKLADLLWPLDSTVAQQLYFFPLLFGISIVLVLVQTCFGLNGLWVAAWMSAVTGLAFYPQFYTGFSWGVFDWGICFYAAGYLMFQNGEKRAAIRIVLIAFTAVLILFSGTYGLVRCVPLWLLNEGRGLRLDRVPLLAWLGDASGTIYIYHTPFIVLPLAIVATYVPGAYAQFLSQLGAAMVAIAICGMIYEGLKNTKAKVLLM